MYVYINFDEICKLKGYENYKLCYVDSISKTVFDLPEELKEEYSKYTYEDIKNNWVLQDKFRYQDLPNPEYNNTKSTHYAYFTPLPLTEQWGDDWNDAPYEHNAGIPYDDIVTKTEDRDGYRLVAETMDVNILVVRFAIRSHNTSLPRDYDPLNSPFSVEMINNGVVAWLYDCAYMEDGKKQHVTIHAGVSPYEFSEKIDMITENNKDSWYPYDEDED